MHTGFSRPLPTARRQPLCYGHRGARGHAPENTLFAFEMALVLGADGIECDVQRSSDGQLVILHDGTVDRTTNGHGLVSQLSLAALRALDAGCGTCIVATIPTLEETLAFISARGCQLNLEIKGESPAEALGTAEAVARVLASLPVAVRNQLLVSSFELAAVANIKRALPDLRVATLHSGRAWLRSDILAPALEMGAEAIHPGHTLVNARLVTRAHEAGLRVNVWTANRISTISRLLALDVDGLFGDYPERIVVERMRLAAQQPQLSRAKVE